MLCPPAVLQRLFSQERNRWHLAQASALLGSPQGDEVCPPTKHPCSGIPAARRARCGSHMGETMDSIAASSGLCALPRSSPLIYHSDPGYRTAATEPLLLSPGPAKPSWGSGHEPQQWALPWNQGWGEALQDPTCHPALHQPSPDLRRVTSVCSLRLWLNKNHKNWESHTLQSCPLGHRPTGADLRTPFWWRLTRATSQQGLPRAIYILPGFELPMNLHHKYLEEGEGVKETKTF